MNDVLPYIDRYFNSELSTEEKKAFESRCLSDPAFARMVAFYISLQEQSQQQWAERKKQQFAQLEVAASYTDETFFSGTGMRKADEDYGKEEQTGDIIITEETDGKAFE